MNMIEKVARAMLVADGQFEFDKAFYGKGQYLARARAAIEAMREPTDEMFAAGLGLMETRWQAMIDAALKEEK